jgi:YegS/Rv2252/BmrU family lipid kinase
VLDALRANGAQVHVVESRDAEHACAQVPEAVAADEVIVAAGGDGMLASLAGAVVEHGAVLGIAPLGRGNDFARMLHIGSEAEGIAHHLLEGEPRPVDAIEANGRIVLGSVYAGVDSVASQLVNDHPKVPGPLQYPFAAVRALWTYRPATFTLTVDGDERTVDAYNVVIANSGYYGKGMHIAPMAAVDDGLLDVIVIPAASRLKMIGLFPKVYDGSHLDIDGVLSFRGSAITLTATTPETAYGDGELIGPLPISARALPGALRVLLA